MALGGVIGELVTGMYPSWTYDDIQNNIQHMVMFGCFAFHLACDLWWGQNETLPGIDYITLSFRYVLSSFWRWEDYYDPTYLLPYVYIQVTTS